MEWWHDLRRRRRILALLMVVVLVNAPVLSSWSHQGRIVRSGVDVVAIVVADEVRDVGGQDRFLLGYRLPDTIDPDGRTWPVEVDEQTFVDAVGAGRIVVRVLEDRPGSARVDGQVRTRTGLWVTLGIDAVALGVWLLLRVRARRRTEEPDDLRELAAVAEGDVTPSGSDLGETTLEEGRLRLVGELVETAYGEARLRLPAREARVVLEGRAVLAGVGERVEVVVRPLG